MFILMFKTTYYPVMATGEIFRMIVFHDGKAPNKKIWTRRARGNLSAKSILSNLKQHQFGYS